MSRFKKWLVNKYLPAWARDELLEENQRLKAKTELLSHQVREYESYIDGMQYAIRHGNRITIKTEDSK